MIDLTLTAPPHAAAPPPRIQPKPRAPSADRGKKAEAAVYKALKHWQDELGGREFNRLLDSRAAQRVIKSAPADFDFYARSEHHSVFGLLECKETKHAFRLAHDKVSQLPAMLRRANCGGLCVVLVHHSSTEEWRATTASWLNGTRGDGGSWDLRTLTPHPTPYAALHALFPEVFP